MRDGRTLEGGVSIEGESSVIGFRHIRRAEESEKTHKGECYDGRRERVIASLSKLSDSTVYFKRCSQQ